MPAMIASLQHRGPDDNGLWLDDRVGVALGHRRLSILDLSDAGRQPMESACGRFVIVFNGEIYNHGQLRSDLGAGRGGHCITLDSAADKQPWRGHSDTETVLAAIASWGLERTLEKAIGMFALALWDRNTKTLTLARDRLGEKPLYYGWQNNVFLFGSELRAFKAYPHFKPEIDRGSIALLLRYNYIPSPHSIYHGVRKLPPGSYVQLCIHSPAYLRREFPQVRTYWSIEHVVEQGKKSEFLGTEAEAVDELEKLLSDATRGQMLADVPVGAMLSGGIDSSTVVALMQSHSIRPIRTFCIGFHEKDYNEAGHAKAVARHLGTDHTELYVTASQAMDVISLLPSIYDEPFSDPSQIPTYLVARLARRHVKVSLTGDAGDELFGGYNRYFLTDSWWRKLERLPRQVRIKLAAGILSVDPASWDRVASGFSYLLPKSYPRLGFGDKLHKLASVMHVENSDLFYRLLMDHWREVDNVVLEAAEPVSSLTHGDLPIPTGAAIERMMYLDLVSYLPDGLLVKIDRAAMAVSLETRIPILDHRVVEFAWTLPLSMKVRKGEGKWILRHLLYKYVPRNLVDRPKMGFGVPIDQWLRGPLRDWGEALLDESRLKREGYFHPKAIRKKWQEHTSGRRNWQYPLWNVLVFQAWLEESRRSPD